MTPDDPRHGTNAGHRAHYEVGAPICQPCRDAHADYQRQRRTRHYLKRTDTLLVPTFVVQRRIHALQAIGWTLADIGRAMGYGDMSNRELAIRVWNICGRPNTVRLDIVERVKKAYDEMSGTPGPSARTRSIAAKRGWAPPLAWDDSTIDDPDARPHGTDICARKDCQAQAASKGLCITHYKQGRTPGPITPNDVDPIVVDRILAGDYRLKATPVERVEVYRRWTAVGRTLAELERLTGWNSARDLKRNAA